jgi:hypothetical protein
MAKGKIWVGWGLGILVGCAGGGDDDDTGGGYTDQGTNPGTGGDNGGPNEIVQPGASGGGSGGGCRVNERVRVSNAEGMSRQPAIAWTGNAYLVVWSDDRAGAGAGDLYAATLTPDGGRVGSSSDVLIADVPQHATSPELASLPGGDHVVVFETCHQFDGQGCAGGSGVGTVLVANGQPAGSASAIASAAPVQRRPYVVSTGKGAYVTYRDLDGGRTVIRVARLGAGGQLDGAPVLLGNGAEGHYPHLAAGRDRLGVVYSRGGGSPEIVLAVLNESLSLQKEVVVRTGFTQDATNPVVAWNGSGFALAWEDERGGESQIYTAVAAGDGGRAEPPQRLFDGNGNWPAIASNGKHTLVAFYGFPSGAQVLVARLDGAGRRVGPILQVSENSGQAKFGALAAGDEGDFGVVWQDDSVEDVFFARIGCQ